MSPGVAYSIECPKCHADRTRMDTSFALPGYIEPNCRKDSGESVNATSALPVCLILCPRCHYVELYHDVSAAH